MSSYSHILSSNEDVAVIQCSLYLLEAALDHIMNFDVDSFMFMIKFVLCAASHTIESNDVQEINRNVMYYLEKYLQKMNNKAYQSVSFDVYNNSKLKSQIQVQKEYYT